MRLLVGLAYWGAPQASADTPDKTTAAPQTKLTDLEEEELYLENQDIYVVEHPDKDSFPQRTTVNVTLHEDVNEAGGVKSFDLRVSLPKDGDEEPLFFICSYLVHVPLPCGELKDFHEDLESLEWIEDKDAEKQCDKKYYVESEKNGHEEEKKAGTRMSCRGRIEMMSEQGEDRSIFDKKPDDNFTIAHLDMDVLDQSITNEARLYYSKEEGEFYLTGSRKNNLPLFVEESTLLEAQGRRLGYYKFKCRENKPMLTIKIGVFADGPFCSHEAGKGNGDCENAAAAFIKETTRAFEEQLRVRIELATFVKVDWPCDRTCNLDDSIERMVGEMKKKHQPERAVYYLFSSCLIQECPRLQDCPMTDGVAAFSGILKGDEGQNWGAFRILGDNKWTFTHEAAHSLGFGHFFSSANRDNHDRDPNTEFGIQDYTPDYKLKDPDLPSDELQSNGLVQFEPRSDVGHRKPVRGNPPFRPPPQGQQRQFRPRPPPPTIPKCSPPPPPPNAPRPRGPPPTPPGTEDTPCQTINEAHRLAESGQFPSKFSISETNQASSGGAPGPAPGRAPAGGAPGPAPGPAPAAPPQQTSAPQGTCANASYCDGYLWKYNEGYKTVFCGGYCKGCSACR